MNGCTSTPRNKHGDEYNHSLSVSMNDFFDSSNVWMKKNCI